MTRVRFGPRSGAATARSEDQRADVSHAVDLWLQRANLGEVIPSQGVATIGRTEVAQR